ncbi:hypothetical protein [Streptomyces sp. SID13726]|uniref:hypothetical protein n=1 Tax=Streptomyces sp. SID13726 TaxID=2706058 RepID=UPI0013B98BAE|nr:hypothetical protein [Streptomyces sp. SID13726]NEA98401.1 hypothetical protein [Streptomyces sp. SID13726]
MGQVPIPVDAVVQADAHVGTAIAVRGRPLVGLDALGVWGITGWGATLTVIGLLALGGVTYGLTVLCEHVF